MLAPDRRTAVPGYDPQLARFNIDFKNTELMRCFR